MTIEEVLSKYDKFEEKGYYLDSVENDISMVDENQNIRSEYEYELIAFGLRPQLNHISWVGHHYGPKVTFIDEKGNLRYIPSFDRITPETVLYWEKRYKETKNPLLTVRYSCLVWDFKRRVCGQNYESDLYRIVVDNLLKVINGDYEPHPVVTVNDLEYLFEFTKCHQDDLLLCKNAYCGFEKRHNKDNTVRYWASRFMMMLQYKRYFSETEISSMIDEHESRLLRLNTPNENGDINPWIIEKQASLLADYYFMVQRKNDVKRVLTVIEKAFEHEKKHMTGLQFAGNLEMIQKLYSHYQLYDEAKRLIYEVQKASEEGFKELTPHSIEFELSQDSIELSDVLFGKKSHSDEERWKNFVSYFIPYKDLEAKDLKELSKNYPLRYIGTTKLMDEKGRPTALIGSVDSDFESNLALHVAEKMKIRFPYLELAIKKMIEVGAISTLKLMNNFVEPCPLFDEKRYKIIGEALDLFFDGKYVLFSHLIVPQLEEAIRNLIDLSMVSVLKPQKNGKGFKLKTLDDLLREQPTIDAFTEDGSYYLRIVLTNQLGLNIRNNLCHGSLPAECFGYGTAGWLLHVFMMIGQRRLKE